MGSKKTCWGFTAQQDYFKIARQYRILLSAGGHPHFRPFSATSKTSPSAGQSQKFLTLEFASSKIRPASPKWRMLSSSRSRSWVATHAA